MKKYCMLVVMLLWAMVNAQASTIILKDGRTITGNIIQQDKTKVIVKNEGTSLTYYMDDIESIDGVSYAAESNEAKPDPEKAKLAEQLLNFIPPQEIVSNWVEKRYHPDKRHAAILKLNSDQNIHAIGELMEKGWMEYYSLAELKAMINFYSSPDGKDCLKSSIEFNLHTMPKIFRLLSSAGTDSKAK